jgi:hypothetical protein
MVCTPFLLDYPSSRVNDLIVAPSGKAALPTMAKENRDQYLPLSAEEKTKLVENFADFRVTKAVGT